MANQVMNAAVGEESESSKIPYFVQSRLETLAVMIETSRKNPSKPSITRVKAIIAGGDDGMGMVAAQSLADMLAMPLQYIDIAVLYEQYCGEAEHHLERLLENAQASHSIVVFNRLDALFGYGPHVSLARQRHVQLDVDYFMKALARYQVPVIIRTRVYHWLDRAIIRQFACVIDLDDGVLPRQWFTSA